MIRIHCYCLKFSFFRGVEVVFSFLGSFVLENIELTLINTQPKWEELWWTKYVRKHCGLLFINKVYLQTYLQVLTDQHYSPWVIFMVIRRLKNACWKHYQKKDVEIKNWRVIWLVRVGYWSSKTCRCFGDLLILFS